MDNIAKFSSVWIKAYSVHTNGVVYIQSTNISTIFSSDDKTQPSSTIIMLNGDRYIVHGSPDDIIAEIVK